MFNELMLTTKNDKVYVSSRVIAEKFNKEHKHVLDSIRKQIEFFVAEKSATKLDNYFIGTTYTDDRGKTYPEYLITRNGFTLLVMGFTGEKAFDFKIRYIEAFNYMEKLLLEKQTTQWVENRTQSKLSRKSETDIIKQLVEYAKEQGSENADKLYITYSKLANKTIGIESNSRDNITSKQLNNLSIIEEIILNCIRENMEQEKHYKDIYQACKERLELFSKIAYLKVDKKLPA